MEIEVGEYIRVDNGIILRYDFIQKNNDEILLGQKGKVYSFEDEEELEDFAKLRIVKHSKNIIDLIEVGDYVNGDEVIAIDYDEDENGNAFNVLGVYDIDDDYAYTIELSRIHIKTILTKEQYEQNSYKL